MMKYVYNFSKEKNFELIKKRGVSFEEIISAIENDSIIAAIKHPNYHKYPNQQVYIIEFKNYAYSVPFIVQNNGETFLKTIFLSRKATKKYLKDEK